MYVIVDRERCAGLGICESVDPDRFEIDDDGELALLRDEVSEPDRADVEQAVAECPNGALRLVASRP